MTGAIRLLDSETMEVELQVTRAKEDTGQHFIFPIVSGWAVGQKLDIVKEAAE